MFGPTQREIGARDTDRLLEYEMRKKADLENALDFYIERCQTLAEQIEEAIEIKLNQLRHAAEYDDVSRSQPIAENHVEPGKEHITGAEFQGTPHEYSVPDTTQNDPEKDSNAVFLTSDEATDERCLVGARVARIWVPQAFVSPFHRPPRKPLPEELPGPEDVTPVASTLPLRPPPEPPPNQI
jgi:hypothetical protein